MNYRTAGVNISKGDKIVANIRKMMGEQGSGIGHFGGTVEIPQGIAQPMLVSSIDGVGTKIKVATAMNKYDTIGQDLVHHCIDDIACCGAQPLAFLDYIAMSSMDVEVATAVIGGIIEACRRWNVRLAGGENAEMPGVYNSGELDLIGTVIGVVDRQEYIDGSHIDEDDVMIGFPSNGLHTNGYSLARRIIEDSGKDYREFVEQLGSSIGDALLEVHTCYLGEINELRRSCDVKGLAHITGGGIIGNISRIIPKGLKPVCKWGSWVEPPVFNLLRKWGEIPEEDMKSTFNLGVGLVAMLKADDAGRIIQSFPDDLLQPFMVGMLRTT